MKIAVFGANGPTGRLLTQLALGEDHDVVAFTRHADAFPIEHRGLEVAAGDVHDAAAVMHAAGVERLATVSSSAVSPHPEPLGGFIFEKIIQPYVVNKLGKTMYDDMRRMEAIVSASDLAWTIVRASGLFEAPAVSAYGIAIDHIGHRFTARIDLADCLLRQALGDTWVRSTIAVATPSAKPSMLKLIWQEGIRKKA
jgi:uncharacterized protein YbjT (DUF2867 family)